MKTPRLLTAVLILSFFICGCSDPTGMAGETSSSESCSDEDADTAEEAIKETVGFTELKKMLYLNGKNITIPFDTADILSADSRLTCRTCADGNDGKMKRIYLGDELVCSLTTASSDSDIDIPEGSRMTTLAIRNNELFSLFDDKIKTGTTLDEVVGLLGKPIHNDEYTDYSYRFVEGNESILLFGMLLNDNNEIIQLPDICYIG